MLRRTTTKVTILVRKNLKMTAGKMAAQAVHAAIGLGGEAAERVVVLQVTDKKFKEAMANYDCYVVRDAGLTEVPYGTETALAYR